MTKIRSLTIACAFLVAPACSSGSNKGTTGTSGPGGSNGTGNSSPSGTGGASTGTGANGTAGASSGGPGETSGNATGGATGGASAGGTSSGGTTGPSAPNFALSAIPDALTLPIGGQETIRVDIQRDAGGTPDTDTLLFGLISDAGVTGIFNPLSTAGGATALTIEIADSVSAGSYPLTLVASSESNPQSFGLTSVAVTVSSEIVTTLLIDNDDSQNNADGGGLPSPSDALFAQLLQSAGILYNTYVIPTTGDTFDSTVLANYSTVLWYTGANSNQVGNGCLSSPDETFLEIWLDEGNKQLLMFSPFLVQDLETNYLWGDQPSDTFLAFYVGAQGCDQNPQQLFDGQSFVATGVAGTAFGGPDGGADGGEAFQVVPSPIADTASVINPGDGGTQPLVTVAADELGIGEPQALPCTVINSSAGQAGTSTVVFVGIPIEDIQTTDAGGASSFFTGIESSLP